MDSALLETSKMGFGCMRLPLTDPEDQTAIDIEQLKKMVDAFLAAGHTYFDTAYVYHNGHSETALKEALVDRYPRESFTLATKCLAWTLPNAEAAKECLDTSLKRLGTDYVDFYLLHNIGGVRTAKFDEYGLWEWAAQKKAEGVIKNLGFSIHDNAECIESVLAEHPDMDFIQIQVNYLDWEDPVTESRKCMEVCERHGIPVVIMEPARGGRLITSLPEKVKKVFTDAYPEASLASWPYRFCWNLPNTIATLSGASSIEQMEENLALYAENKPFDADEKACLDAALAALRSIDQLPCTACRYCVKDCPQHVMIPEILGLLNLDAQVEDRAFVKDLYSWQTLGGKASTCIACGECETMCPQKIDIVAQMERATEIFE